MGIANYAAASIELAQELADSLSSEDVEAVAADLSRIGLRAWLEWQDAHEGEVADYVAATPGQRARKKAWADPPLRRRLALAALSHCQAAHLLLDFLSRHAAALVPGGPYRGTTALAGTLYWDLMDTEVPHWPAQLARVCPSPF